VTPEGNPSDLRPWAILAGVVVPILAALLASHEVRGWLRGTGSLRQTFSNAGVGFLFLGAQLLGRGALLAAIAGIASAVPYKWPERGPFTWAAWALAFVLLDLVYYVQHRLEHAVPLLWAVHAVHHQSRDYNLSVSFRVGVLSSVSTLFFHALLALLGVSVTMYGAIVALHATLLFMLHARTKFTFGPGRFFNAPVFHRVHHGMDDVYIDKNFGGVFLIFDRLFGTFAPYTAEPAFGVAGDDGSPENPLVANVAPFAALADRLARQATWRGKLRVLFVHDNARREPGGA
jgi:sterol desaturase/sphingolipid hydroxylase (fatty acid hydroxylase superfamily)